MSLSRCIMAVLSVGLLAGVSSTALSQSYPNKSIRIVTAGAGGGSDFVVRALAQAISGPLGQPVIVDNRSGGVVAAEITAKAPPDGYTLLVGGALTWLLPLLQKVPYDAVKDLTPVSLIARGVNVVVVHPAVPAKSIPELIALAKSKPGALNYGSSPPGSNSHLAGELFKSMAGVNIVWVPFKGTAQALTAQLSNEVQVSFVNTALILPHVKSGRLRALAVASPEPTALAPGLPTVAASGLPGYEAVILNGLWTTAKTPSAVVTRLNQETVRALNQQEMKERFFEAGLETIGDTPQDAAAKINADIRRMGKVIKEANIKIE